MFSLNEKDEQGIMYPALWGNKNNPAYVAYYPALLKTKELKDHFLKGKQPEKIIDYSFTKLFQPRKHESNYKNVITLTRTYNPNYQFSFNKFKNCIKPQQIEDSKLKQSLNLQN